VSAEGGDLNFREFEIINVIDTNEDWLTGQVVGQPERQGIFPANFVIKFNLPIEYIGKFTVAMAAQDYAAQNQGELSVNASESQLIALKKISPDGKWSFGEIYDNQGKMVRGWFPVQAATSLIDSGVIPLYSPNSASSSHNNSRSNSLSNLSMSPPPPPGSPQQQQQQQQISPAATPQTSAEMISREKSNGSIQQSDASSSSEQNFNSPAKKRQSTSVTTSPTPVNSTSKSSSPLTATAAAAPTPTTTPAVIKTDSVNTLPSDSVIDQVQALYDFQSSTPETISFSKDAVINILEKSGDWWLGELNGKIGLLPFNYVQSILTLSNNG
jgi:hypothetical protein